MVGSSILILDDSELDQYLTRKTIDQSGRFTDIIQFTDPISALAHLRAMKERGDTIDLLLSDFRMPCLSGYEFFAEVHSSDLNDCIKNAAIMVTVPLLPNDIAAFSNLDPKIAFISKPVVNPDVDTLMVH